MDFDELVEEAINAWCSDDDIAVEYTQHEMEAQALLHDSGEPPCNPGSHSGSLVERVTQYRADHLCCSRDCCGTWTMPDLLRHAEDLGHLSKTAKKLVVLTVLRNGARTSEQTRYSTPRQRLRFTFRYEPFGRMCVSAFRVLFDIRPETFKGLVAHLKTHELSIIPPVHGNTGKPAARSTTLRARGSLERIVEFMLALAESQGEFSPGRHTNQGTGREDRDPDQVWLPGCLTRMASWRMYLRQHPQDRIGRTAFCDVLSREARLQHIKIRSPRSDMCDYCELQKRKIAGTKPHDEARAEQLTAALVAHQAAYQGERAIYKAERERALADRKQFRQNRRSAVECIDHIGIDFGQSVGVPHTTDQLGGTFYLHMRNFHLFGLSSVLAQTQVCYTYDERQAGKGANEVISFLHQFLATREIATPHIRLHADNCRGQNKNKYVLWYLLWLAATGRVEHVELKFMIKGHTHFIVDSGIGHIKREFRRADVFCLEHWAHVINRSATTNVARVVDGNDVYDWKTGLAPYFKALNGISTFQHFAVDRTEPGWIWTKYGWSDKEWRKTRLLKSEPQLHLETFQDLPKHLHAVGFKGGKPDKEQALFKDLRPYVKDEWKDEICPDPEEFQVPVLEEKSCPDWRKNL